MAPTDPSLLTQLGAPEPGTRARGIASLRYRDLRDPDGLAHALACCRDLREVEGSAPRPGADPIASFFDPQDPSARPTRVADLAAARLEATGFPPDQASIAALAGALAQAPSGTLPQVAIGVLCEGGLDDLSGALRALIPPLVALDVPLYEVIARTPAEAWPLLAGLAAEPLAPRLWQELLNHAPAHAAAVEAVRDAVCSGRSQPTATEAATILGVLSAWGEHDALSAVAEALQPRWPWAAAWWALSEDPGAGAAAARLGAWLQAPTPAPEDLQARIAEAMVSLGPHPGFPLGPFLRWAEQDHGVLARWGAPDPDTQQVLRDWVRDLGVDPDRAWRAVQSLCEVGAHTPEVIELDSPRLPWSAGLLSALAQATPPVPWLRQGLLDQLPAHLTDLRPAVEALVHLGPGACTEALEIGLSVAEAAPLQAIPLPNDLVRIERVGVDVEALAALAIATDDADLVARVQQLEPVVRLREQNAPPTG